MTTTNNITTSTVTINNYPSTYINTETESSIPTKTCTKCHQIKQLTEFHKDNAAYDGYRTQCKNCRNNVQQQYYNTNKDKNN